MDRVGKWCSASVGTASSVGKHDANAIEIGVLTSVRGKLEKCSAKHFASDGREKPKPFH